MSSSTANSIWAALKHHEADSVRPWLRWHPGELDACLQARSEMLPDPLGEDELAEMNEAHVRWNADSTALANVERLGDPSTRVIVAGQQPGLLGGPLYTLYKAIGAIRLARETAKKHSNLNIVPVFWVASEDHDYAEVSTAVWPETGSGLHEFALAHPDWEKGRMVGTLSIDASWDGLEEAIRESTQDTEFKSEILKLLRESAKAATWEDGFCRLLLALSRETGLIIVSPLMRWVRRRAIPILRREVENPARSTAKILERSDQVAKAGFPAPLHRHPDAVNCFFIDNRNRRLPIRKTGETLTASDPSQEGGGGGVIEESVSQWRERLEAHPETFSTNVVTRPLVQDAILPTVAQMVGAGEAAYLAQVESVYESFGVFAPVRYPRPRALLVPPNVSRTLKKYSLDPLKSSLATKDELVERILEEEGADDLSREVEEARSAQLGILEPLRSKLPRGSGPGDALERLIQSMEKGFQNLNRKIREDYERKQPQSSAAAEKILTHLRPEGQPQERIFNPIVPFLIQYGPVFLEQLREELPVNHDAEVAVIYPGRR